MTARSTQQGALLSGEDRSGSLAPDVLAAGPAAPSARGLLNAGDDASRGLGKPRAALSASSVVGTASCSAIDWLSRVWPGVWLEEAGFQASGAELARRRVVDQATANEVIGVLGNHGAGLRAARDEAWRPLRQRLFGRYNDRPELWSQVADGTCRAAAGAAAHGLGSVAAAAMGGCTTVADVHRVLEAVRTERLWQRIVSSRTDLPWPWPVLVDTVTHAAHVVAWAGVDRLDRDQPGLLDPDDPALGWGYAFDAAQAATARAVARLDHVAAMGGAGWVSPVRPGSWQG